jgi:hypothetical protein
MQISVNFDTISPDQTNLVIDYYNQRKPEGANPLEKSYTAEGGFMIALTPDEMGIRQSSNPNDHVKQVRWNRKSLVSSRHGKYAAIQFAEHETLLLYDALCYVFGDDKVSCHNILE